MPEELSLQNIAVEEHCGNPNLGEMLVFILDCLDQGCTQVEVMNSLKRPVSAYVNEHMPVSTSGAFAREAPHCTIEALSVDRVMIAMDYPFASTQDAVRSVDAASLTKGERTKIYRDNAAKLLGINESKQGQIRR